MSHPYIRYFHYKEKNNSKNIHIIQSAILHNESKLISPVTENKVRILEDVVRNI